MSNFLRVDVMKAVGLSFGYGNALVAIGAVFVSVTIRKNNIRSWLSWT